MYPQASPTDSDLGEAVSTFVELRPRLFGIAYRVLGSAAEAEDVVQEAWLRWQRTDRSVVVSPAAFLSSTTTRLAINVAQSARVRRETYIGPWLPEPIDTSIDPVAAPSAPRHWNWRCSWSCRSSHRPSEPPTC